MRENVTLIRRKEQKEPILVSYIVPDLNKWQEWQQEMGTPELSDDDSMIGLLRRFSTLCDHVRDYLRTKLADYAVPAHYVPLLRMPLNPNGKIDKVREPLKITFLSLVETMVLGCSSISRNRRAHCSYHHEETIHVFCRQISNRNRTFGNMGK